MSAAAPVLVRAGVPRVNLMPKAELDRRERARLTQRWLWGVLGALILAGLLVAGAAAIALIAAQSLVAEQARTNQLLVELGAMSEVSGALATEKNLTVYRSEAMGSDFAWAPVAAEVQSALPSGVQLTGFDLIAGPVPQGEDPLAEVGLVGTMTLNSTNAIDIAETVRGIRALEIVIDADGAAVTTSSQTVDTYTYQISVVFNQTIYSGEYAEGTE